MLRLSGHHLFQSSLHARERGIQAGAEARHDSDDRHRNAGSNQTVFNCSRSVLVSKKTHQQTVHGSVPFRGAAHPRRQICEIYLSSVARTRTILARLDARGFEPKADPNCFEISSNPHLKRDRLVLGRPVVKISVTKSPHPTFATNPTAEPRSNGRTRPGLVFCGHYGQPANDGDRRLHPVSRRRARRPHSQQNASRLMPLFRKLNISWNSGAGWSAPL